MAYLAEELQPRRILLVGETDGVLRAPSAGKKASVIPLITPGNIDTVVDSLGSSYGMDVTGGMASKVLQMLQLVRNRPGLIVHIVSGHAPAVLTRALLDPGIPVGTRIVAHPGTLREGAEASE
jgi:isopentenyl phosphate kinase